jgi:hypothetical protein
MPKKPTRESRKAEQASKRRKLRPTIIDEHQFYSIEEAAAALDKSRMQMFTTIKAGLIETVPDGARRKIVGAEIMRFSKELVENARRRAPETPSDPPSAV